MANTKQTFGHPIVKLKVKTLEIFIITNLIMMNRNQIGLIKSTSSIFWWKVANMTYFK